MTTKQTSVCITQYPRFVKQIWICPDAEDDRSLAIAALGLIGEAGEVTELFLCPSGETMVHDVIDECGDVLYYATVLSGWLGIPIAEVEAKRNRDRYALFEIGRKEEIEHYRMRMCMNLHRDCKEVSERFKKLFRDGREITRDQLLDDLGDVLSALAAVLSSVGANLQSAMIVNVDKLSGRYAEALGEFDWSPPARIPYARSSMC